MQQPVTLALVGEVARDVVQHQHEPGDGVGGRGLVADGAHRRHLHAQQLPPSRAGDELRGRVGHAALQALLHAVERMRHQLAVEHAVDRTADAQQLGPTGHHVGQRAELQPRAGVVQQHAAVEVAHHHALRQLGHQRGQTRALGVDVTRGGPHALVDVGLQRAALLHQLVDHRLHGPHLGTAGHGQLALHVAADQHLRLLGHAAGGGHAARPQAVRQRTQRDGGHHPAHHDQRQAAFQHRGQRGALGGLQRGHEGGCAAASPQRQHHGRRHGSGHLARVELHVATPSIVRTRAASSLVEKGLVM